MKVRSGFVSNSSTSSFLIYGTIIEYEELEKLLEAKYGEDCETYEVLENEGLEQYSGVGCVGILYQIGRKL